MTERELGIDANYPTVTPADTREEFLKAYREKVARLGDELDAQVKLIQHARVCLETELFSGMGYKQMGISASDITRIGNLTNALNSAVNAKVRFDKAAKDMVDSMTPEQEFESVWKYIKTLEMDDLETLYKRLQQFKAVKANYKRKTPKDIAPDPIP